MRLVQETGCGKTFVWNLLPLTETPSMIARQQTYLLGVTICFLGLGGPSQAASQADGDPVALGTYRVVHSEILGEDRVLQVHLPRGYESSESEYPVVYLFYSDFEQGYYAQTVNDLYHLSTDRIPRVILVGLRNTQRYRDFYPWPMEGRPDTGKARDFMRALEEEIIPFVEREYRTKPYRILIGPQAAAVFGAYALLEAPGTFQAFILNDPCRLDSPERSLCREIAELAASEAGEGLFFAVGHDVGEDRWPSRSLADLSAALEARASDGFRWRIDLVEDWPFFLSPVTVRPALLDLFSEYPFPSPGEASGWEQLEEHYGALSASLGFSVEPPSLILTQAAVGLRERREYVGALEVLNQLVDLYPSALDGPWQLGHLYREMGDTASAIRYYEECLRRDPNMMPARQWLERLRGRR
jgi:predicted alpha/beta superfamily hydrolase